MGRTLPMAAVVATLAAASAVAPSTASAALSCSVNAGVPPLVRSAGLSESVGDVVIACPHDPASAAHR
jgi:hypothetical protein